MRNVFDQYSQPENRLTHALASSLSEDRYLLKQFVKWITVVAPKTAQTLEIVEQRLPGELEITEEESERRGLPDAWIHDSNGWSLLLESKVSSSLSLDQLRRHHKTALRRGFEDVTVLAISVSKPKRKLPKWVKLRTWSDIYEWLVIQSRKSEWAKRATQYFEVAETKFSEDGYLKEGTLTVFSGIPFNEDQPYNYPEAKRLLKLAMDELRQRKDLVRELGMNPKGLGRGAITGKGGMAVWDFLRLKDSRNEENFTKYPHLTLAFQHDRVLVIVTVPHGIKPSFRRNLINLGTDGFFQLMEKINKNMSKVLRSAKGVAPWVEVVQRRYPTQRSAAIMDAALRYDLRTAFPMKGQGNKVKVQTEWLSATYEALSGKRSNLQIAVGAVFPYQSCKVTQTREILDYIANTWIACRPLIAAMLYKDALGAIK